MIDTEKSDRTLAGQPAVFFDRDNTLIINDGYLGDPAGVVMMPGAAEAIAGVRKLGFAVVTISNQSGVARGLFDEAAVRAVNQRMDEMLLAIHPDAQIDLHVFCPFHPDAKVAAYRSDSNLRKPKAGMIQLAAEKLKLDLAKSWVVGDAPRDVQAGINAGCKTILFTPPDIAKSSAATETGTTADAQINSLEQIVVVIQRLK